jgi:fido (protein-threonine AMPylation protein)
MGKPKISSETSWKETKFGILPRSKVIQLEIQGTQKGLLLLQQISKNKEPLSIELIKNIHKDCFGDVLRNFAGTFRSIQVEYSGKEAPHFSKVHEMMQNLVDDIEHALKQLPSKTSDAYITDMVQLLALLQHRFVVIHPFVDYNGRMSRMFTNYFLMREELPTIEIPVTTNLLRKKYIQALQKADEGNYQSLQDIIGKALNESLESIGK